MASENYEDVRSYTMEDDVLERLLGEQTELNFMWSTKDHWAVGVFMSFVWHDGSFWVTLTTQRARMRAIERDPRVSVAVSSVGTSLGRQKSATAKGRVRIHDDDETKAWFYPALAKRVMPDIAMAKVAMPEGVTRVAEQFGIDPEALIRRTINIMGIDKPRQSRGPAKRVSDALRRIWPS